MSARSASLRKKNSSAVPLLRSGHMSAICAVPSKERGDSQEGGNLGVYPLVRPPRRQEPFAYPAKNSRPLETNTLTQFVSPSHPVPRKAAQNSRCAGTAKNTKKQPPEGDCLHFGFTLRCS